MEAFDKPIIFGNEIASLSYYYHFAQETCGFKSKNGQRTCFVPQLLVDGLNTKPAPKYLVHSVSTLGTELVNYFKYHITTPIWLNVVNLSISNLAEISDH